MRKTDSGSAGTGGAGVIKSNRREGEGQRGSSGDDEGMRCSRERGKAAAAGHGHDIKVAAVHSE